MRMTRRFRTGLFRKHLRRSDSNRPRTDTVAQALADTCLEARTMNRLPRLLSRVALACAIAAPFVSVPAIYAQDAAAEPMPDEQPATTDGAAQPADPAPADAPPADAPPADAPPADAPPADAPPAEGTDAAAAP